MLSHKQVYDVCNWLRGKKAPIISTYEKLAKEASAELGFDIPKSAVKRAIDITAVSFVPSARRAKNFQGSDRIVRLARSVVNVIDSLEKALGPNIVDPKDKAELVSLVRRNATTAP